MKLIIFILSFICSAAFAESVSLSVSPANDSGYIGEASFKYGISNCYGDISAAFGGLVVATNQYLYEGKTYTPADLGLAEFSKPGFQYTTIFADLFHGNAKLGERIKMDNVTFFSGVGCFSETYHVTTLAGVKDADYKSKVKELSLQNFEIRADSRSIKVENLILKKLQAEADEAKALKKIKDEELKAKAAELKAAEDAKKAAEDSKKAAVAAVAAKTAGAANTSNPATGKTTSGGAAANAKATSAADAQSTLTLAQIEEQKKQQLEDQKKQQVQKIIAENQEQYKRDQIAASEAAQGVGNAAAGFASGISGSGNGIGLGILYLENTDKDSPFEPLFIGMVFGKVNDPTLEENKANLLSGIETQAAFNQEWGNSPPVSATNKYTKTNRRWDILMEMKFFANITALSYFQPYAAMGFGSYADFDRKNNAAGTGWSFVTGYGIALVTRGGYLRFGYNNSLKVSDFGFCIHM